MVDFENGGGQAKAAMKWVQFMFDKTNYTKLAETARQEAYDLMVAHARELDADAVVAMRYDANEIMDGITEVLAYGTAVKVERL